jgi:hypothetical protein
VAERDIFIASPISGDRYLAGVNYRLFHVVDRPAIQVEILSAGKGVDWRGEGKGLINGRFRRSNWTRFFAPEGAVGCSHG